VLPATVENCRVAEQDVEGRLHWIESAAAQSFQSESEVAVLELSVDEHPLIFTSTKPVDAAV
jgi:hypothetical protein